MIRNLIISVIALAAMFNHKLDAQTPLAEGQPKFLGCAWSVSQATDFEKYWNQITPENGGKWGSVERIRDAMVWTEMDAAFNIAVNNNFHFKNHTLIWGNQQPAWIENLDSAGQMQEIIEWFASVAARYDNIDFIDVVNEPLHAPPSGAAHGNYINALGGTGDTGWDWVINSFKLARQHFPNSQLLINEYNIVNSLSNTLEYIEIINLLKADGLIDGIGIQAHAFSTNGVSGTLIQSNLDLLGSTDLPIYVSEMDVDGPSDLIQLLEYQRLFPLFWNHPDVAGITLWGFRYGLWRTSQGAYLVSSNGTHRPAFQWLKGFVNESNPTALIQISECLIEIYPNPAVNGQFVIYGIANINDIMITDIQGRIVKSFRNLKQHTLDVSINAASGMYFVIFSDKTQSTIKKIILN